MAYNKPPASPRSTRIQLAPIALERASTVGSLHGKKVAGAPTDRTHISMLKNDILQLHHRIQRVHLETRPIVSALLSKKEEASGDNAGGGGGKNSSNGASTSSLPPSVGSGSGMGGSRGGQMGMRETKELEAQLHRIGGSGGEHDVLVAKVQLFELAMDKAAELEANVSNFINIVYSCVSSHQRRRRSGEEGRPSSASSSPSTSSSSATTNLTTLISDVVDLCRGVTEAVKKGDIEMVVVDKDKLKELELKTAEVEKWKKRDAEARADLRLQREWRRVAESKLRSLDSVKSSVADAAVRMESALHTLEKKLGMPSPAASGLQQAVSAGNAPPTSKTPLSKNVENRGGGGGEREGANDQAGVLVYGEAIKKNTRRLDAVVKELDTMMEVRAKAERKEAFEQGKRAMVPQIEEEKNNVKTEKEKLKKMEITMRRQREQMEADMASAKKAWQDELVSLLGEEREQNLRLTEAMQSLSLYARECTSSAVEDLASPQKRAAMEEMGGEEEKDPSTLLRQCLDFLSEVWKKEKEKKQTAVDRSEVEKEREEWRKQLEEAKQRAYTAEMATVEEKEAGDEVRAKLSALTIQLEALREVEAKVEKMEKGKAETDRRISFFEQKMKEMKEENTALRDEVMRMREKEEASSSDIQLLQKDLADRESEAKRLQDALDALTSRFDEDSFQLVLAEELRMMRESYTRQLEDKQKMVDDLKKSVARLTSTPSTTRR
uniref:Uncharacterized protein n=1 Tax=Palpitomonas bilix TaxID=652834 RepID=A0A7S3D9X0_9EUKA|mmetsp:Transcript_28448/g.72494  ORF Transcript_28448/g.72494 Transcript_28448/m.72494 type:complete len:722 (+) Transcript_28448:237-2402(+)